MSFWSRITNVFRGGAVSRDLDEELAAHLAEAATEGRDPVEARRAFGSPLRRREESRDIRLLPWLDSLRADAVFGWRQIRKKKIASAAAILSLALAMGTCATAFRLIDALLLRPLPVANADRLYVFAIQGLDPMGHFRVTESCEYPLFESLRRAARGQAELMAASWVERIDLTFASDQEMETAYRQYVSGWMFPTFKLRPALGRLFDGTDDDTPGKHPYAVLSYDYWTRRFGRDPKVLGRTFHSGTRIYQIIGVAPRPFTGTEPGTMTDIFIPAMMNAGVTEDDWAWIRTFVALNPGTTAKSLRDRLQPVFQVVQEERAKGFTGWPKAKLDNFLHQRVLVERAAGGVSQMRKDFERALTVLAALAALVLLITCANLANLLTAQAAVRAREMALRVSIGAGRGRLIQLVLAESAMLALLAVPAAALFAAWAAPFVVDRINPPDQPARLALPPDWRVLGFALVLAIGVTVLSGLAPALRASAVKPASALKGGDDPHARRRLMHVLIAVQVAFCFAVLFLSGLFAVTFQHLSNQPTGFSADRLLAVDTSALPPQPPRNWEQVAAHLRELPGVERVAMAAWPLLSGRMQGSFVIVNGQPASNVFAYSLRVSPGWLDTMNIPLIDGRDLRPGELGPGAAVVNEAFAKQYFHGENPVGKTFEKVRGGGRFLVVGLVPNARYQTMREPLMPTAYIPMWFDPAVEATSHSTFLVRTSRPNPLALAPLLRREVPRAWPQFRVNSIQTQAEINRSQTVRERLLAMLAVFFAVVALLLAAIGLYGVLDYSVVERRREIGIRIAIGAQAGDVARRVTAEAFAMVLIGALAGIALGTTAASYIETLLYGVKPGDVSAITLPALTILTAALLAAVPAVIRAVRIDPAAMLREE
ncbi:MAG: ADOP family duplicated permease [Bryobacteraceae bacterium]